MGMKIEAKQLYALEQHVLTNYINRLIIKDNKNLYVSENDLINLNLSPGELSFVKQVLKKHAIEIIPKIKEQTIEKKDRTKLVKNYTYGEIKETEIESIDKPVYATLEYDSNGNLIYEDWDKLEEFIEDEFIPDNIVMKQLTNPETKEISYYPSIQLNRIVKLQLCEAEVKHIIEYLGRKKIRVGGKSSTLVGEFENYDYVYTYKEDELPECVTPEATLEKIKRYKANPSKELKDEIITNNMRLASFLAYKYSQITKSDIHELESYAYEGLIKSLESFKLISGCKFSTYAYTSIRWSIIGGLAEIKGYKKSNFYSDFIQAKLAVEEELETTMEESPYVVDEIVELLAVTGKIDSKNTDYIKTRILLHMTDSLDEMMDDKEVSADYSDEYLSNDYINENLAQDNLLYLEAMQSEIRNKLYDVLDTLTNKERYIMIERYGLGDKEPRTLESISKDYGVTRESIRQTSDKALRKLRHPYRSKKLRDLYDVYKEYNYEPNPLLEAREAKQKVKTN